MAANAFEAVLNKAAQVPEAEKKAPARARKEPAAKPFYRPAREGRRFLGGHFDPAVAKQLRHLAVEEDTTIQGLLEEALDLLFVKKGKSRIASLTRK